MHTATHSEEFTDSVNTIFTRSAIENIALERALKMLIASKASYAVQMPDGSFVGDLIVLAKPPRKKMNDWRSEVPGYIEAIRNMQIGDVLSWSFDSHERCKAFRFSMSSQAVHHHGRGAVMTTITGTTVEALRLE